MNGNDYFELKVNYPIRNFCFLLICLIIIAIFVEPLKELVELSFNNRLYSHFLLIPFFIAYFFVRDRKNIFAKIAFSPYIGTTLIITGLGLNKIGRSYKTDLIPDDYLFLMILAAVICLIGSFLLVYGNRVSRKALFSLSLFLFMMPVPSLILDPLVNILTASSALATEWIFRVIDVPHVRKGYVFELVGITIEIVKGCSGIRSTLVLLLPA